MTTADFHAKYGPWALIAGASEGLGAAFAEEVAARGLHLLLIARRKDVLAELAQRLSGRYQVEVRAESIDLGAPELLERIRAATHGLEIGLVVYNAAYSIIAPFLDQDLQEQLRMIDVNCRGPVMLAHELGRPMLERGRGGIVLMSSLAGSQGSPFISTYGATKAFNLVLAEGLWHELAARGVDVIACRAGATRTPGFEKNVQTQGGAPVMEPRAVAHEALEALGRGPSVIPGWTNRMLAFLLGRVMPRQTAIKIMGQATKKMFLKA